MSANTIKKKNLLLDISFCSKTEKWNGMKWQYYINVFDLCLYVSTLRSFGCIPCMFASQNSPSVLFLNHRAHSSPPRCSDTSNEGVSGQHTRRAFDEGQEVGLRCPTRHWLMSLQELKRISCPGSPPSEMHYCFAFYKLAFNAVRIHMHLLWIHPCTIKSCKIEWLWAIVDDTPPYTHQQEYNRSVTFNNSCSTGLQNHEKNKDKNNKKFATVTKIWHLDFF